MNPKKIISLLLLIIMAFSLAITVCAVEEKTCNFQTTTISPRYINFGFVAADLTISNRTATCECSLTVYKKSQVTINFTLQKSLTENGNWNDYRDLGSVIKTATGDIVASKSTSALPTGFYRLKAEIIVTANNYSETTTIYSSVRCV